MWSDYHQHFTTISWLIRKTKNNNTGIGWERGLSQIFMLVDAGAVWHLECQPTTFEEEFFPSYKGTLDRKQISK